MSTSTITVGGQNVVLVAQPPRPGMRSIEFNITDAVAAVSSPFTMQTQTFVWRGADMWGATLTLPPMAQADLDEWVCFLMEMQGKANAVLLGDPLRKVPKGYTNDSVPVIDGSVSTNNGFGATQFQTKGWKPSTARILVRGDYLQVGYRLHRALNSPMSDSAGNAVISVWPSLREHPADGDAVILNNPRGLFRLAQNKRTWSQDFTKLGRLSFQVTEYR